MAMLSAEPEIHISRAQNGGTVPRLRSARANEPEASWQKFRIGLSRSDFSRGETSGNALKLTKISCDIAATLAAPPCDPDRLLRLQLGRDLWSPHKTVNCPKPTPTIGQIRPSPSTPLEARPARPWQKLVARPVITSVIVSCCGEVQPFPPTDILPLRRAHHHRSRVSRISLLGQAFQPVSPQRKSLPLWSPKH